MLVTATVVPGSSCGHSNTWGRQQQRLQRQEQRQERQRQPCSAAQCLWAKKLLSPFRVRAKKLLHPQTLAHAHTWFYRPGPAASHPTCTTAGGHWPGLANTRDVQPHLAAVQGCPSALGAGGALLLAHLSPRLRPACESAARRRARAPGLAPAPVAPGCSSDSNEAALRCAALRCAAVRDVPRWRWCTRQVQTEPPAPPSML